MLMEAAPIGTQLIQMYMYTLHRQDTSLWLTSWIPSKRPLYHSRREQWRSGGFSLYLDSQDGDSSGDRVVSASSVLFSSLLSSVRFGALNLGT